MAGAVWAEDEIGRKWDRCFTDAILKLGGGVALGGVFSLFFFKRRRWPIIAGAGFGLGMAYSNCERDINASIHQQKSRSCKSEGKK
ncbi:MICOS complex subunit Mic10 [Camponotus floridanus]|uniref:MICOS complex subunit Mic10 n=1 Tax=Camponotus floridanus TaxID=104421 RepID=UPI00059E9881|nr:MICOS complex subunit Mic10 [Camponotus floridanus]